MGTFADALYPPKPAGARNGAARHGFNLSVTGGTAMADEDRSFARNRVQDRAQQPAESVGQREAGARGGPGVGDLGQEDRPQQEWGPDADEEALFSANHTRRPVRTEAERGQGAKTRKRNKDIISRRP
jgi:hypothetical protein